MAKPKDFKELNRRQLNWFARHKVLSVVLGFIIIGIIGSAFDSANTDYAKRAASNPPASNVASSAKKEAVVAFGQPARDGKFEFVVQSMECGKTTVGTNPYLTKQAQGQFCLLTITVKNIGDASQSLYASNQKLIDADKKEYSADDSATFYVVPSGASSTWLNDINPGNGVTGVIVFDVAKGVQPTVAELHDSAFSGGVKAKLQ